MTRDFDIFIRRIGLSRTGLGTIMVVPLPAWVRSKRLRSAQVSDIRVAVTCEGSSGLVAAPMKEAVSPAIMNVAAGAEGAVAGGTAGKVNMAANSSGSNSYSSSSVP